MLAKDKFQSLMRFEPVPGGYLPQESYFWETIRRWYGEGLPAASGNDPAFSYETASDAERARFMAKGVEDIERYFEMDDSWRWVRTELQQYALKPQEAPVVVKADPVYLTMRQGRHLYRVYRDGHNTMKLHLRWPVADRDEWIEIKDDVGPVRLREREPAEWRPRAAEYSHADYPVAAYARLYGGVRDLFGPEALYCMFYDDPALVEEIVAHMGEAIYTSLSEILRAHRLDLFLWSEDFCYKVGPLFSYEMFRTFFLPTYRRVNEMLAGRGVSCIMMETDGDCRAAVPWMIEAGATGIWPFECTNGQNVVDVRRDYADLQIFRGIDKKVIASGDRSLIDRELESKLPFMLERRGYLPGVDHAVPHDISFDAYRYYRELLRRTADTYS